jgi:hypothetical protein
VQILALKLILTPLLTGVATWAGRKYGHNISGLLIGLPLNAGPIALFLVLQHGKDFSQASAKGMLFGAVSLALYASVYALLSKRYHFIICGFAGLAVYLAATLFFNLFNLSLLATFVLDIASLLLILKVFPKATGDKFEVIPPRWDIPLRVVLATLFIILLTYISEDLGPNLSGLLSTFPVFGLIFATTTHHLYGYNACRGLLKAVVISLISSSVFFVLIACYIKSLGIFYTFTLSTILCLVVQGLIFSRKKILKKLRIAS